MPRRNGAATSGAALLFASLAAFAGLIGSAASRADEARQDLQRQDLQLDVIINSIPANMIGSFVLLDGKHIAATRTELEDVGLHVDAGRFPQDLIVLDDVPTLRYRYDERTQSIAITVDDAYRRGQTFDVAGAGKVPAGTAEAGWGALLNYDLLSSTGSLTTLSSFAAVTSSLTLDARAFSPYGTFEQSGIIVDAAQSQPSVIRLDSSFRHSDAQTMITYRAGDFINGGLPWSRPLRMFGVQAQSNFALRPDLITTPLPSLSGIATVPSTVDVYINSTKAFSEDVAPGPFTLNDVPVVTGAGNARLVVRDSAGHETETTTPFFASPDLLRPGLGDWSIEAGLARLGYGSVDDRYALNPVASLTLRRGFSDWLTGEAHVEGSLEMQNGGVGAVLKTGNIGVAAASLSLSRGPFGLGAQAFLSFETSFAGINLSASTQRTFGNYEDLAAATAQLPASSGPGTPLPIYASSGPPRELDSLTLSAPLRFDPGASLSGSYLRQIDGAGNRTELLSGFYSRSMPFGGSLYADVFHDFSGGNTGFFMGLSVPLGASTSLSAAINSGHGGSTIGADIVHPLGPAAGSVGWRLRDAEGAVPYHEASLAYRSAYGTAALDVSADRTSASGSLELRGAVAVMDGGLFFSDWIDDGFAVVDAGAPGVTVLNENRAVGVTGGNGMLLVPALRSYQANRLAIDPTGLPLDSEIATTHQIVAPADGAGVAVHFDVASDVNAALVTFVRPDGSVVPAGAAGQLKSGGEFTVGYDGQAYVKDLTAANEASIELLDQSCTATFNFAPARGRQVQLGPVTCR